MATTTVTNPQAAIAAMVAQYAYAVRPQMLADACRRWAVHLQLPAGSGIDGARLLWALSGCESSFGANCTPRHEPAYCAGGRYGANVEVVRLTGQYGHAAHASFGPWQLLLINALSSSPEDMTNVDRAAMETVAFLNRRILMGEKAATLAEIAAAYNCGDWRVEHPPEQYVADCERYYAMPPTPMPPALPDAPCGTLLA